MTITEQEKVVLNTISKKAEVLSNYAWLATIAKNPQQQAKWYQTMVEAVAELQRLISEELPEVQS